ncbi:HD domain-containing protein [candidate division WOR-3 bacterium]|nr:HD domain-containing protein [candidate division WOR-3 bacterium]
MLLKEVMNEMNIIPLSLLPWIIGSIVLVSGILFVYKIYRHYSQHITHLKSLRDIDRIMLSNLSHKGVLNAIIDKLNTTLNTDAAAVFIVTKDKNKLNAIVSYNISKKLQKYIQSSSNGFITSVIDNRKPLIISKIAADEDEDFLMTLKKEGFISYMASPITINGNTPIGVLTFYSKKPRRFTNREIEFINAVSDQIAITLDRTQLLSRIQESSFESVRALVEAIEIRDLYTRGHSVQVAELSVKLARAIGFTEKELTLIEFAGLLHDIGKIAIPEMILQKKGHLTTEEWSIIKKHPGHSVKIIEPVFNLKPIQDWILYHHERWDGEGYPFGKEGKEIPIQSRILSVCDTFSAMIEDRPYRKGLAQEQVKKELKRVAGTQFDPGIVDIFLNLDLGKYNTGPFYKLRHQLRLPLNRKKFSAVSLFCSNFNYDPLYNCS